MASCGFTLLPVSKASPDVFRRGVVAPPVGKQIAVYGARVINRAGSAIDVAIVKKLAQTQSAFSFGQVTAALTPQYTDKTAAIQAGGTINIFDTTANDGMLIGAPAPFNVVSFVVSQAESGSPVYTYQYFNGSIYTALTTLIGPTAYTAGTIVVSFLAPIDWVPGTTAAIGGFATNYNIKIVATTAPGQAVQATSMYVGQFLKYQPALADKTSMEWNAIDSSAPILLSASEEVAGYFATANSGNAMEVLYSVVG